MVDGYDDQAGEVRNNRVTGFAIERGASLFGFVLMNVTVIAAGRSAPAAAPRLLLPTILLTPAKCARGTYELKIEARTIASVRVVDPERSADARRVLTVAQPSVTVGLALDDDDRATVLLEDGHHTLAIDPRSATVHLVIDETSPAWLDVTFATGP
jgi:hypothetical protein